MQTQLHLHLICLFSFVIIFGRQISLLDQFEIIRGLLRGHCGLTVGVLWYPFGITLGRRGIAPHSDPRMRMRPLCREIERERAGEGRCLARSIGSRGIVVASAGLPGRACRARMVYYLLVLAARGCIARGIGSRRIMVASAGLPFRAPHAQMAHHFLVCTAGCGLHEAGVYQNGLLNLPWKPHRLSIGREHDPGPQKAF